MALELVFERPRTLKKLRSGPLGELLEGFCDWLLEHGFALRDRPSAPVERISSERAPWASKRGRSADSLLASC